MKISLRLFLASSCAAFLASLCAALFAVSALAQQPPKKYDPATLQSMEAAMGTLSSELAAFRAELAAYNQRTNQMNQRVNGIAADLKSLRDEVSTLDVTQNSDRTTRLEDRFKQMDADQARREAASKSEYETMMALLKWIGGGLGALIVNIVASHIRKNSREKRVDANLESVKSDTLEIKQQTNGVNDALRAENARLASELASERSKRK